MHISAALRAFVALVTEPASWEEDPGYRELLVRINRRGLVGVATVALVGTFLYVATALLILRRTPIFIPEHLPLQTGNVMIVWDKLLMFGAGFLLLVSSRTDRRLGWGRLAVALTVVILSLSSVFDEVIGGSTISRATVYPMVYLLFAAVAIAYRPLQVLVLTVLTYSAVVICEAAAPILLSIPVGGTILGQLPFVFITTVVIVGISTLLSATRHDQYQARMEAQRLAEKLEAHALELEDARAVAQEQSARLVEAERMKDRFFANISHEFRTPLTLIMGPVEDALAGVYGDLSPTFEEMLSSVKRSSSRLLMLVSDLLDLSKLDANRIRINPEEHDLVDFLRTVVHFFVDEAARRRISLKYQSTLRHLPVSFDHGALEKVVHNLLSNAFKFVSDGGAVTVKLEAVDAGSGTAARITVKDNGAGIDADQLAVIFERWKGSSEGTGVGLALVKEMIELHGGEVAVESERGFGSEFSVSLPLSHAVPETASAPLELIVGAEAGHRPGEAGEEEPEASEETAPVVLVVENDADVRAYVRRHLRSLYRVHEARDGVEALESIRQERPALVISDIMMPRMDGVELCRKIKTDAALADLPVVLLTALADEQDKLEGLEAGADDYIPKPFSSSALVARVENLIELRRLLRRQYTEGLVEPSPVDVPSVDETFMQHVKASVEKHIGDSQFGVEWLADEVHLSARQLQRRIRAATRLSAAGYIRLMRLKRAAQLLSQHAGNVSEVARAVGWSDAAYFSRLFKQTFGTLPSEYIKRASANDGDESTFEGLEEKDDSDSRRQRNDDAR